MYVTPKRPVMPAMGNSMSVSPSKPQTSLTESIAGPQINISLGGADEKLDGALVLRAFLAARLPAIHATESNLRYLTTVCPSHILDKLYEDTGGAALVYALAKGSPETASPALVAEIYGLLIHTFRSVCPFYDQPECSEVYNWAADKLQKSSSVSRLLEEKTVGALKTYAPSALKLLNGDYAETGRGVGDAAPTGQLGVDGASGRSGLSTEPPDPILRSDQILKTLDASDYSYLRRKCHTKWPWQQITAGEFVSGALDPFFEGCLGDVLAKTRLKISDVVLLFGIEIGGTIPRRLWSLGYSIELHVVLPPEKCPATTLRSLFPRLDWSKDIVPQYRTIHSHVYNTIDTCYTVRQRWLILADLKYSLGASTAESLVQCMRYWSDFTRVSVMVQPHLTCKLWVEEFGLTPRLLLQHESFGFKAYKDGGIKELERRLKTELEWTDDDFVYFIDADK